MQNQVEAIIRIAEDERLIVFGYQKFCLSGQRIGFMMESNASLGDNQEWRKKRPLKQFKTLTVR